MIKQNALLKAYRGATTLLAPLGPAVLNWRKRRGKEDARRLRERLGVPGAAREDARRLRERLGVPGAARPTGPLAWLHGASVGEGLALLPLIEQLRARGFHVLVTTGTVSSAQVLAARLPGGAIHQYIPLDAARYMRRFLDHWRPDLVMLAESELWPNLIMEVKGRDIPLVLVNARLSERSFQRWQRLPGFISSLLGGIDLCLAQSRDDAARLMMLGAPRVQVVGNLKFDVPAPPVNAGKLADITAMIGPRPVWVAASTHAGEEEIALAVHRHLLPRFPNLLTIIVPRHAPRGADIAALAGANGMMAGLRSRGEQPGSFTGVYIADTMGELGLFYRVASIVYLGKSMVARGGQNPIEPAKLGAAILHGPHVANFGEVYRTLDKANGAIEVGDADTLARTLSLLLSDTALLRRTARAASEAVDNLGGASANILSALEPYFMHMRMEHR
jgi:3-deoxy-D-manno-octulosonic-acid transferase